MLEAPWYKATSGSERVAINNSERYIYVKLCETHHNESDGHNYVFLIAVSEASSR